MIEISLRPAWRSALFVSALLLAGALLVTKAVRVAIAMTLAQSSSVPELQRALTFDPDNPEVLNRLGLVYSYASPGVEPQEGVNELRRAVELNPQNAKYWMDLGAGCDSTGDTACADQAFERARVLSPGSPRIHWFLGNHYLQADRIDEALPVFRHLLEMSPDYARPTFRLCLRVVNDPEVVFQKVLPSSKESDLNFTFVNFLTEQGNLDSAFQIWNEVVERNRQLAFASSEPFLDILLGRGKIPEAHKVWLDLGKLGAVPKPAPEDQDNLIYDGGFERPPLNGGFDWRYGNLPFLSLDFADSSPHHGANCLRVDFTVSRNEDYLMAYQVVPVAANQQYVLEGYFRSDAITSNSGPRFRVVSVGCPQCPPVISDTTVGTTEWHPVSLKFNTGPETKAVRIDIWRPRGRDYPMEISGSFWLDDVSLKVVGSLDNATSGRP
jgi:tetratricopeptide (TPR) repeat protein